MTFITNADVPSLAMKDIIENPINHFTGADITVTNQKTSPQLILIDRVHNRNETEIEVNPQNAYYVHDNIFDEKDWNKLGKKT